MQLLGLKLVLWLLRLISPKPKICFEYLPQIFLDQLPDGVIAVEVVKSIWSGATLKNGEILTATHCKTRHYKINFIRLQIIALSYSGKTVTVKVLDKYINDTTENN
jgi:hypothetical protein